jgi:hypothetical protein
MDFVHQGIFEVQGPTWKQDGAFLYGERFRPGIPRRREEISGLMIRVREAASRRTGKVSLKTPR